MPWEIEETYLVRQDLLPELPDGMLCRQGYLSLAPERIVRVRAMGGRGILTVKGRTKGAARPEFEYAIPLQEAEDLLATLCLRPLVGKMRHPVPYEGRMWTVDVFLGMNRGLVLAEVELVREGEACALPPWTGRCVTGDVRFRNANLVRHPFCRWERDKG